MITMRRRIPRGATTWVAWVLLAAAGCAEPPGTPADEDGPQPPVLTAPAGMDRQEVDRQLDEIDRQLDRLRAAVAEATAESADDWRATVTELDQRRRDIMDRLTEAPPGRDLMQDVQELRRAVLRSHLGSIETRADFQAEIETRINAIDRQLETSAEQLDRLETAASDSLEARLDDAQAARTHLAAQWRELAQDAETGWHDMRTSLIEAWTDAQRAADRLVTDLGRQAGGETSG